MNKCCLVGDYPTANEFTANNQAVFQVGSAILALFNSNDQLVISQNFKVILDGFSFNIKNFSQFITGKKTQAIFINDSNDFKDLKITFQYPVGFLFQFKVSK